MSIVKTEDSINVLLGEKDISVFTCLVNNFPTLIMQEITEEMRQDEGFPYSYKGKSVADLPHVRLTFKNKKEIDKLTKWLSELSDELKIEEEFYKEVLEEDVMMNLKQLVFEDLKQAMREKDALKKGLLQIVKSNLDMAEKEKGSELTAEESIAVIRKEVKQLKQSIEGAVKANREDVLEQENKKLQMLNKYLPKQLELDEIIPIIVQHGVHQGMGMGDAMKIAKQHLNGKADNGTISKAVKHVISGGNK